MVHTYETVPYRNPKERIIKFHSREYISQACNENLTHIYSSQNSVHSDMGATTVCSRYQMLGHDGGRSLRRLVSVVV
jgi:hypothetical protein